MKTKKCTNWDYHHMGTKCEVCGNDERDGQQGGRHKESKPHQRTPLPWKVHHKRGYRYWIKNTKDQEIGILYSDDDTAQANAAFIVKAVNCHEELVAALEHDHVLVDPDCEGSCATAKIIAKAEGK